MIILKIIARLLDYPDAALWSHSEELISAIQTPHPLTTSITMPLTSPLASTQQQQLIAFIRQRQTTDLLDAQADYCQLFDRGRATSLLLFEHVYAESRDRGQAMVDLMAQYTQAGLAINCHELPDYLPLYLEYLANGDPAAIRQGLLNIAPILALLAARLQQRHSDYALLFELLLALADPPLNQPCVAQAAQKPASQLIAQLQNQVARESRDDTPAALDAIWQEEQIRFQAAPCHTDAQTAHQRRFAGEVVAQYLQLESAAQTRGEH